MAHALRHEPWQYELELDDAGWVPIDDLLEALHGRGAGWAGLTRVDLEEMIRVSAKRRFEIQGHRIRALYGHSVPARLAVEVAAPPGVLFHGTSPAAWRTVREHGLVPMRRQFVHLSTDVRTAVQVGRRKAPEPVLLRVDAARAASNGVQFYRGNEQVWLADAVPAAYLGVDPTYLGVDPTYLGVDPTYLGVDPTYLNVALAERAEPAERAGP